MAHKFSGRLGGTVSRHAPDKLTEELAVVLSRGDQYEFKPLFDLVYENLRARKSANGGEEMLRLRVYEKLQSLVRCGMVKKTITGAGKHYKGLASLVSALPVIAGVVPFTI